MRRLVLIVLMVAFSVSCFAGVLQDSGVKGGVVVCVGAEAAQQLSNDWKAQRYLFQCLETSDAGVSKIRKSIRDAGCYGKVSAMKFDGKTLPYKDQLVNLLVVSSGKGQVASDEIARILAPRGIALIKGSLATRHPSLATQSSAGIKGWTKVVKRLPPEIDDWTHYLHGPDNNAVTQDKDIFLPRGIQWVSGPRWGRSHEEMASMSITVSANGRVYFIADEAPPASIRFNGDWKLIARDAFNGTLLWKRDIPQWIDHLRHFRSGPAHLPRRLVAVGDTVYVTIGLAAPVTAIDGATGRTLKTYTGTEHTEEIIYEKGILYLVAGTSESERVGGGLHLRGEPQPTGFRFIAAVNASSGKMLWKKTFSGEGPLPLSLAVRSGSVFYQSAVGVGRLDAKSGKQIWQTPRATLAKRMGFSAPTLVATDDVLLCADRTPGKGKDTEPSDGQVKWGVHGWTEPGYSRKGDSSLIAYSVKDGKELWTAKCKEGYNSPVDLFVVGGSVWVGADFKKYDLKTGELQSELDWKSIPVSMPHHRCYRDKASQTHIFTGRSGIEVVDMKTGLEGNNSWIRGTCQFGIMPANGMLYAPPDACACDSKTKVQGFFAATTKKHGITGGMPEPAPNALEKGPAYTHISGSKPQASITDWPMYRGNNMRAGVTKAAIPGTVKKAWSVKLGGKLTQPVSVGGSVYVASSDAHTLYALDTISGKAKWRYTAGARIDSSPTIYKGTVIFGSADGWIYCLRASDGALAWRFRAAPREQFVSVFGQLENTWPVHGALLVQNGILYATAGRSSYLDGGMMLYRLDPASGKVLSRNVIADIDPKTGAQTGFEDKRGFDMEGIRSTPLAGDGKSIFMKHWQFDAGGNKVESTTPHLLSASGLLDQQWFVRSYWLIGTNVGTGWGGWANAAKSAPSGRIISFTDDLAYGYGRVTVSSGPTGHKADAYHLFCADRGAKPVEAPAAKAAPAKKKKKKGGRTKKGKAAAPPPLWADEHSLIIRAMALTSDKLVVAGTPDVGKKAEDVLEFKNEPEARDAFMGGEGVFLRIISAADGRKLSEAKLDTLPVFDGLSAANGRVFVSLQDGTVQCWGK